MDTYLYFIVIVFAASLLQAYMGFGFALVAMAFLPLILPYTKAVALNTGIAIVSTIYMSIKHRKDIQWKTLLPILIPSVVIGMTVTAFSFRVDSKLMLILLGVMLIVLAVWSFLFAGRVKMRPTVAGGTAMGAVCGVCNGLFSIGGPAAALYLLPAVEGKEKYFATIQLYFAVCNTTNLIVRIAKGSFEAGDWKLLFIGWGAMLLGTFVGQKIFKRTTDSKNFAKAVYALVGVNGLWLIVSNLFLK